MQHNVNIVLKQGYIIALCYVTEDEQMPGWGRMDKGWMKERGGVQKRGCV